MAHTLSARVPVGGFTLTGKQGQLQAKERYEWFLYADSDDPTPESLIATDDFPIPYRVSSGIGLCISSDCQRVKGNRRLWKVTADFDSELADDSQSGTPPTAWVPIRETYLEPYQEVEIKDKDGRAYTNGAGVPFANAPAVDKDNIRWDFFQFEPLTVTDIHIRDRNNTINDREYLECDKHTLLLKVRKSTIGTWYRTPLRLTEYSLVWKESDWNEKLANVGNSFRVDGRIHPYRYAVLDVNGDIDLKGSLAIHTGPLGNRDVPVDTAFDANSGGIGGIMLPVDVGDDGPSGGTIEVDGIIYAKEPPDNTLFFISRRKYSELNFADILRF